MTHHAHHAASHHGGHHAIEYFEASIHDLGVWLGIVMATALVVTAVIRFSTVEAFGYPGMRLRFTWALAASPIVGLFDGVVALAFGLPFGAGLAAGINGSVLAAVACAFREREDRQSAKEELRRRREELRGPGNALRRAHQLRRGRTGHGIVDGDVILGEDRRGELAGPSARELCSGGLMLGHPGTGKTTAARRVIGTLVGNGWGAVYIDAKASPDQAEYLAQLAAAQRRPFLHFDVRSGPERYNPLAGLSAVEAREFLMRVFREDFDARSAVYRTAMSNRLLLCARVLEARAERLSLQRIAEVWSDGGLGHAARGTEIEELVTKELAAVKADGAARSGIASGLARIQEFAAPLAGRLGGEGAFSLADSLLVTPRPICLISLDTQRFAELARGLAGLIVQDLTVAGGRAIERRQAARAVVVMDEAARYVPENVADFILQTAREAQIATVLATQTPADLDTVAQAFRDRASAGVAWLLGFRLDAQGADWFGREASMRPRVETTEQHQALRGPTGLRTQGAGYEMKIHPSRIQELPDRQAVLVRRARGDSRLIKTWDEWR